MQLKIVAETMAVCYTPKGKTSGSRVVFVSDEYGIKILMHKPHPRKELLEYQVRQLIEQLEQEGFI